LHCIHRQRLRHQPFLAPRSTNTLSRSLQVTPRRRESVVACRRRCSLGFVSPRVSLAPARPGRVPHCCFEHSGQNFGPLDRGPGHPAHWNVWMWLEDKRVEAETGGDARRQARAGARTGVRDRCGKRTAARCVACPATRVIFRSVRIPPGFSASTSTGQRFPIIRWGLRRGLTEGVLLRVPATHDPTNHMDELRQ
jgi:hypothetical protein